MGPWVHGSMGPWVQKYRGAWVHGYRGTGVHGYRSAGVHGYRGTGVPSPVDDGDVLCRSAAESLEAALNTLSRSLESNCEDPEVWTHYLLLFRRRGSREEVQEMCEMAVEHAPHHSVWWTYLGLESSFEGKDYVCERLLQFLLSEASAAVTDRLSFQLMEALLYRVQLHLFTGRTQSALAILQVSAHTHI
ncbi:zinc finger C3H1 domain-containing protein-like, partial [Plectropomus leopardus]|uniref:zinc finger C3H1 domain-containing protein-like n=1 Tax=Plectropomus leopardus TaxID=160734 RepID=UPI001C4D54D4